MLYEVKFRLTNMHRKTPQFIFFLMYCTWRYVSKFRPAVLMETKSNKHPMRTMGPAEVEAPSPQNYLKSHSKDSKSAESKLI